MLKPGTWWLASQTDPRWNCSGHAPLVGAFARPPECDEMIAQLTQQLGEPPDDLEWRYMKD